MEIVFNGVRESPGHLARIVASLGDPGLIVEKGGFIFKSLLCGDEFRFGVLPSFQDGERTYHYNIDVGEGRTLTGFINPNATMTVIFNPSNEEYRRGLGEELILEYRGQYCALGEFLTGNGFPASFKLDQISSEMLAATKIFPGKINCIGEIPRGSVRR